MEISFPTIKTDRFLLRQFTDNDLGHVFHGLSHPDVIRYYGISYNNLDATREQMEWFKDLEDNKTGIWWAICSKDNELFCGAAGLNDINRQNRKAEIGIWLLPEYWGKKIMNEVLPMILGYGFNKLKLHRIECYVDSDNTNCKKGLNKLDFIHEGTMVDCELKNNKFISIDIYAKFNSDR